MSVPFQLAFTHSSYKVNFGTNPDHVRNSLSNCGNRMVELGDHRNNFKHTKKKGEISDEQILLIFDRNWRKILYGFNKKHVQ